MATHVALESVHHLHRVHDVVAGGWAHHLRCRTLAGSASCVGNGPAGRAGQAAHNRSCPGPQGVRQYRSLRSLPCGVTQACAPPLQAHLLQQRDASARAGAAHLWQASWRVLPRGCPPPFRLRPLRRHRLLGLPDAPTPWARMLDAARPTWRLQLRQLGRSGLLCCVGCWWGLAIACAESALRCAGGRASSGVVGAPWPAGRAPSARELSLSVCRHLARACSLCSCVMQKG